MLTEELHSSLIYLDRDFVAGKYEILSGQSASSQITLAQGKKAAAGIPVFSAEVSVIETRSYPISTLEMLDTVLPSLSKDGDIDPSALKEGMTSQFGWVTSTLSTLTAKQKGAMPGSSTDERGEVLGCFTLRSGFPKLTLITTPDYFVSGMDALLKMHKVLVGDISIPIRAYVRIIAAKTVADDWIAIPYVMHEYVTKQESLHTP